MFDDRLFDVIMGEMMSEFGADVRTDEGSLAYNACVKIAEKLEEIYGDMDEINENISLLTKDLSHLIDYGAERGIEYKYATAPTVKAVFDSEQEIGERFVCNDFYYTVSEKISDFEYKMICDTEGTEANANFGTLEAEEYSESFTGGEITEILTLGTDDEDTEVFRARLIEAENQRPFGGNRDDYKKFIDEIEGVGGCKPKRREKDGAFINITVISSDFDVPSEELIDEIQTKVDPTENSGEGDGKAPICHNVKILPVEALPVKISIGVVLENDVDETYIKSQIESAIKEYLLDLRSKWESNAFNDSIVRISQVDSRALNVAGVSDIFGTKINGNAENLAVEFDKIPVFGGVEFV